MRRLSPWLAVLLGLGCPEITDQLPYAADATAVDDDDSADDDDSSDDDDTPLECDLSWIVESAEEVSLDEDVQPIFDRSCSPCHTQQAVAELRLSPGTSYWQLVGVPNFLFDNQPWGDAIRVVPGDPQASYLLHKMLGCERTDDTWGYFGGPMPAASAQTIPVTDEQKSLVWSWILQGAANN